METITPALQLDFLKLMLRYAPEQEEEREGLRRKVRKALIEAENSEAACAAVGEILRKATRKLTRAARGEADEGSGDEAAARKKARKEGGGSGGDSSDDESDGAKDGDA